MADSRPRIIYTLTDEAPALATHSLLPILRSFASTSGVDIETRDISLAARILSQFPERLTPEQQVPDALTELGNLAKTPEANIIKLPNVSASVPQLRDAITELQDQGYDLPDYPDEPETEEEEDIRARYDKVKGSAVNPVLREGNSDRRAPKAVKEFARSNPHSMGEWDDRSLTHVATMKKGDFRSNEKSVTVAEDTDVRIEHVAADGGAVTVLKASTPLLAGEILDGTFMSRDALVAFLEEQVADARKKDVLFSLHMKATMMKVSDPIIFGHAVRVYFADFIKKHAALIEEFGCDFNNGFGGLDARIKELPDEQRKEIEADLAACYEAQPDLAMVNSDEGITNLHVPSDVIVDASMPAMIRSSGKMWNKEGKLQDTKAVIPDSSYAGVYAATIDFCREHGAFDPTTMGTVPNVGLMAQKAEEYGSHDKTFVVPAAGTVRVVEEDGTVLMEHEVEEGDIWRACQTKDAPIRNWVELAVKRARATDTPAVFWLDDARAHDDQVFRKVRVYLQDHDISGLDIQILPPVEATQFTLERIKNGEDTISVTGNVLRDYLTDLFPILELGTSAKMLSIVPLMNGGGLFETGAGGSAPKHVQQFVAENHLRWDSLGEFLALAASFEHLAEKFDNPKAAILGKTLDDATSRFLMENRSPSRKVNEIDNRGSHFYLALYWAEALAAQDQDAELKERFAAIATLLAEKEDVICKELLEAQGQPVDLGGYFHADPQRTEAAMRPSATLNAILG